MTLVAIPRFIGPVPIDAFLQETHRSDLSITRNPIEFGADVTDHAYVEPKQIIIWGGVGSAPGRLGIVGGQAATRVSAAYEAMVALQESREPFDIVTGLTFYEDMLIESIEVTRHKDNSNILEFYASLREVIIVESTYAEGQGVSKGKTPGKGAANANADQRAAANVNRGQVGTQAVSTDPGSVDGIRNRSILTSILD